MRSLGRDEDGVEQFFGVQDGNYVLKTTFDNEPTLDRNKALQNEDGFGKGRDMWLAASIPIGVQYEWRVKHGVSLWDPNHKEAVRRLLNSNEWRYLRCRHFVM